MVNIKRSSVPLIAVFISLLSIYTVSCQWNPSQEVVDKDSSSWMSKLNDNTPLTSLVIPGTHDTLAIYDYLIGGASAAQDIPLFEQLDNGVRFIDVRISKQKDGALGIYHGIKYMYVNFDDVVAMCRDFLKEHPSEFIIMMAKEEVFQSSGNGSSFTDDIYDIIENDPTLWADPTKWQTSESAYWPEVGELRGKILLLRNYKESSKGTTKCISIYDKNDNWVRKGDTYKVPSDDLKTIDDKWNQVSTYIANRAKQTDDGKLYMHSVAAYNALIFGLPNIDNVAKVVNPRLITMLESKKANDEEKTPLQKKPLGILMCDKVNPRLISAIYNLNF